jgi:hypothetical protein
LYYKYQLPSYKDQPQEKHKWPTAKSSQLVCSICSSAGHLGHHKMPAPPLHFSWIHCTVIANRAEVNNNIKSEQSKISGQQSSAQNGVELILG